MNIIDLIIYVILIYAIISGFREGLIIQACSFVPVVAGIVIAMKHGAIVAVMFGIDGEYSEIWGFILTLVLTTIAVSTASYMAKKILYFAGFGLLDAVLGAALSLCKYLLVLSLIFSAFDIVNDSFEDSFKIISQKKLADTKLYRPITNLSNWITPALKWGGERVNTINKKFSEPNDRREV